MPTIPIKNPRSAALVGLTMAASDEEFLAAWQSKFPDQGVRANAPTSFDSRGTDVKTSGPVLTGDAQKKASAQQKFMDEVYRLMKEGRSYSDSWYLAGITEPGKSYAEIWMRGDDKVSLINTMSDGRGGADLIPATDRHDPQLEASSQQKFVDLTERLLLEGNHQGKAEAWAYASMEHPDGKKLWATWKHQSRLKKMELLAAEQKMRSPHLYT
jgi:hypothetical protein